MNVTTIYLWFGAAVLGSLAMAMPVIQDHQPITIADGDGFRMETSKAAMREVCLSLKGMLVEVNGVMVPGPTPESPCGQLIASRPYAWLPSWGL